jgi:LacI family transcriptional regulator
VHQALRKLPQQGLPIVVVDHRGTGGSVPSVVTTNCQGTLDGTRYLLGLGHRRIGFITGDLQVPAAVDRLKGYRQALEEAGLLVDDRLIYKGDFRLRSGYSGAKALMELANPPTAIIASNDDSAIGVMDALRDLGYRIAEDVSVLGFDDIRASAETHPPLTTIRQPLAQMGRTAVELLLCLLEGKTLPVRCVELPTKLVVRGSCARPSFRS